MAVPDRGHDTVLIGGRQRVRCSDERAVVADQQVRWSDSGRYEQDDARREHWNPAGSHRDRQLDTGGRSIVGDRVHHRVRLFNDDIAPGMYAGAARIRDLEVTQARAVAAEDHDVFVRAVPIEE